MRNLTKKREPPLNRKLRKTCKNHPKQPKRSTMQSIPKCRHANDVSESPQNSNRNPLFPQPEVWYRNNGAKGAVKKQEMIPCFLKPLSITTELLDLCGTTGSFDICNELLGFFFGNTFLEWLGSTFDKPFCFF